MSEKFGKGALRDLEDKRDIAFSATAPFDWDLGFDIELLLGYRVFCGDDLSKFWGKNGRTAWGADRYREIVALVKANKIKPFVIQPKNQGSSSSCTGQALSQYLAVLNMLETGKWIEISARDIYAYISLGPNAGANLRDALKLAVSRGIATEKLVPSYDDKTPKTETEYLIKPEETDAIKAIRTALEAKEYQVVVTTSGSRLEQMAWATLQGFGCYFGVTGTNNGTWMSLWPQPPAEPSGLWGHALFAGKVGLRDGKKFVGHINSWGSAAGESGWQCLDDSYIDGQIFTDGTKTAKMDVLFNPWTLIDKDSNSMTNVKVIKDQNSSAVGFWIPAISEAALESLALNFGKTVPKLADGTVDWNTMIEGVLSLK